MNLLSSLISVAVPRAYAVTQIYWPPSSLVGGLHSSDELQGGAPTLIQNYMGVLLTVGFIVTVAMMFVAGIVLMIGMGSEDARKLTKKIATWAPVGFIFELIAYAIVSVALNLPFFSKATKGPELQRTYQEQQQPAPNQPT
jgi:hypothetical protein